MTSSNTPRPYRPRGPRARIYGALTPADREDFLAVCAERNYRPTAVIEYLCVAFTASHKAKKEATHNG